MHLITYVIKIVEDKDILIGIFIPINITDFQVLHGTPNPQSVGDRSFKCAAQFFKASLKTGNSAMTLGQVSSPSNTESE